MKIRQGFVSNSSTTSFCIFGAYLTKDELSEKAKELAFEGQDEYDFEEEFATRMGLEIHHDANGDPCFGRSWTSIGLDETGRQFRESVDSKIKEYFANAECSIIEDAFRDG